LNRGDRRSGCNDGVHFFEGLAGNSRAMSERTFLSFQVVRVVVIQPRGRTCPGRCGASLQPPNLRPRVFWYISISVRLEPGRRSERQFNSGRDSYAVPTNKTPRGVDHDSEAVPISPAMMAFATGARVQAAPDRNVPKDARTQIRAEVNAPHRPGHVRPLGWILRRVLLERQKVRSLIARDFARGLRKSDAIISTHFSCPPFKLGERTSNRWRCILLIYIQLQGLSRAFPAFQSLR